MSDSVAGFEIPEEKLRLLFALLFSSPEPVNLNRIREVLYPHDLPEATAKSAPGSQAAENPEAAEAAEDLDAAENPVAAEAAEASDSVGNSNTEDDEHFSPRQHLEALEVWILKRGLPLELHQVGRSWRLLTSEDVADDLASVRRIVHKDRLGPAALETLSLVAYRQPILKADIDAVRGVKSGPHLRHLLDMRLVRILGRADLPGRPFLYGTTREFLDRFGLQDLKDLPEATRLSSPAEAPPAAQSGSEQESTGTDSGAESGTEATAPEAEVAVESAPQGTEDPAEGASEAAKPESEQENVHKTVSAEHSE